MTADPESPVGVVLMAVFVVLLLVAYHVVHARREYGRRVRRIGGVWDRRGSGEAERYALERGWGREFTAAREARG